MDVPDPAMTTQPQPAHSTENGVPERSRSPPHDVEKAHSEGSATPPEKETLTRDVHGLKWVIGIISILSSTFLSSLDYTIVADVQPAIFQCFCEIETLSWLGVFLG